MLKISATITQLTTASLNVVTTPAQNGNLCRLDSQPLLTSIPYASNISVLGASDSTTIPSYIPLSLTSVCTLVNSTDHASTTGATYNVTISNADTYPIFYFDFYVKQVGAATPAWPYITFNGDAGSNYLRRFLWVNSTATLSNSSDTFTSVPLSEVNGVNATDIVNTAHTYGTAYLKSGSMRSVIFETGQSMSGAFGLQQTCVKWTNTASVVTQMNIVIPNYAYCNFRIYQLNGW